MRCLILSFRYLYSMTQDQIRKNIWKIYAYCFFLSFLLIMPILVPYWESHGLKISEIFLLQGIFGGALLLFDLPAGYLADLLGRRKIMILGSAMTASSYVVLWLGTTFSHFVVFEILVGLGLSLQSGCDVALLFSQITKLHSQKSTAQYLGKRIMVQNLGEALAALLGGALATISLSLPVMINAITPWFVVLFALLIHEPVEAKLPRVSHLANFMQIHKALFGHSRLLTLVIANLVFYSFATYCAVWSLQPYWKERGLGIAMFGYLWAGYNLLNAIVAHFAHQIEKKIGSVSAILIIAVAPVIGYLGMGFVGGLAGIFFSMAFPICRALNFVIFMDALNHRIPPEIRATANSIGSLGMRILFLVFGPLLGWVIETRGASSGMIAMGCVYVVLFFALALPLIGQRRDFRS